MTDFEVELTTAKSIEFIRSIMIKIADSHVMIESLNYIEKYDGERWYDQSEDDEDEVLTLNSKGKKAMPALEKELDEVKEQSDCEQNEEQSEGKIEEEKIVRLEVFKNKHGNMEHKDTKFVCKDIEGVQTFYGKQLATGKVIALSKKEFEKCVELDVATTTLDAVVKKK